MALLMKRYEQLYHLYEKDDTKQLRALRQYLDVFPPLDSKAALDNWQEAKRQLESVRNQVQLRFEDGEILADIREHATRDQAFQALDLYNKYGRPVNGFVLDVDETLRSTGETDNEIPRETLQHLTELHDNGLPIVICTGQTLENVKGFLIQGLGSEIVHSGNVSIVYESGNGVFTPNHGADTKRLLYRNADSTVQEIFETVRSQIFQDAPQSVRDGCHLQGNEFNVTLKPNYNNGSQRAAEVIDAGLVHIIDLLGSTITNDERGITWTRAHYAARDPEIRTVLSEQATIPSVSSDDIPSEVRERLEKIDVAYYEADAAEISSLELNKREGVKAALSVLGIEDPFLCVMGDSKTDRRVMEWAKEEDNGISAAPKDASEDVVEFVSSTDDLLFEYGGSAEIFSVVYAMNRISSLGNPSQSSEHETHH